MSKPALTAFYDQLRAIIREHGWAVQIVGGLEPPIGSLAYTVGLTNFGHPEVLAVGLGSYSQGDKVAGGMRLEHGQLLESEAWLGELRVHGPVEHKRPLVWPVARAFYGSRVPVMQILWPDPSGKFADEGGERMRCSPIMDIRV